MEKSKKKKLIIIFGIILLIIIVCIIFIFLQNKQKNNETDKITNNEDKAALKESELEITDILRDYYISNNLLDESNLKEWNFTSVTNINNTNDKTLKYYEIEGNYSCKDNSYNCVYLEQVNEPTNNIYPYKIYIGLNENKKIKSISGSLTNSDNAVELQNPLQDNNKYAQLVKDYYLEKKLVDKENLRIWNINSVTKDEYEKDNYKYYTLKGTYSCIDNSYNCLYLSQVDDQLANSTYKFSVYIEVIETETELKIITISDTKAYPEQESQSQQLSKDDVISILKAYYQKNNFQDVNNTKYWNINEVIYYGYRQSNQNIKYYYITSTFMCSNNTSNCIYIEQADDSNKQNEYTFNGYIGFENSTIKSISENLMYDDMIIVNSILN